MSILPALFIPKKSRAPKPAFWSVDADAIVGDVQAFVKEGGDPHRWRGHTHDRPTEGEEFIYLGEFSLPKNRKRQIRWAACPCCTDHFPKYKHGIVVWFPSSGIIRLIGKLCFRRLDPDRHQAAWDTYKKKQREKRDIEFLLQNVGIIEPALSATNYNASLAEHLDKFRLDLKNYLQIVGLDGRLQRELRDGSLRVTVRNVITRKSKAGKEERIVRYGNRIYARIHGYEIFQETRKPIAPNLRSAAKTLESLKIELRTRAQVSSLDSIQKRLLAKKLSKALGLAQSATAELQLLRRFLSAQTISTLRTWGQLEDTECRFYIEKGDDYVYVGRDIEQKVRIVISPRIDAVPWDIPRFGKKFYSALDS